MNIGMPCPVCDPDTISMTVRVTKYETEIIERECDCELTDEQIASIEESARIEVETASREDW